MTEKSLKRGRELLPEIEKYKYQMNKSCHSRAKLGSVMVEYEGSGFYVHNDLSESVKESIFNLIKRDLTDQLHELEKEFVEL